MNRYLLDTNIIIDHLHGDSSVAPLFIAFTKGQIDFLISVITKFELLSYPQLSREEEDAIILLLEKIRIVVLDDRIATMAALLARQYRGTPNDLFIAATALTNEAPLITHNVKDFKKIKELRVVDDFGGMGLA